MVQSGSAGCGTRVRGTATPALDEHHVALSPRCCARRWLKMARTLAIATPGERAAFGGGS